MLTTERQQFEEWLKFHSDEEECTNLLQRNSAGTNYLHPHADLAWIAWQASRELLANREAQPVLYASEETLAYAKEGEKSLVTWSEPMGDAVIPLFTIPKAQTSGVVNLPTEFISDEGVMVRLEQVMAALALVGVKYERRGDACRAAMLAQPVSSGYKLPPHLYRDLVNSLRDTAAKYQGTQQLREQLSRTLTENGLVAAAPEGSSD